MIRRFARSTLLILPLAACQPPAVDDYLERVSLDDTQAFASPALDSPDVEDALWVPGDGVERLIYGVPGETPAMALACDRTDGVSRIVFTRFAPADRQALAMMALIGNGHIERVPVDAIYNGRAWLWEGAMDAQSTDLEVLTGPREVELTIPGAGSLILHPSPLPRELVESCRQDELVDLAAEFSEPPAPE